MSADVTTTHDKYPPFTRAELQALRDRAEWIGAQLIDPHAARAHLDLAQSADHMDAILARGEARPALKLYDPNADTELYVPVAPGGFAGFDAAVPAPDGEPEPGDVQHTFTSAGPGLRAAATAVPSEKAARMREVLAAMPVGGGLVAPEPPDDSDGVFQRVAERVRGRIVDRIARRHGAKHAAVEAALAEATKDRPLWQWLRDGGLEKLIALVVSLLPLFV